MGSGSGTALGIIGIIIAAGAIRFAFFVWNGTNSDLDDVTDQLNDLESELNDLESDFSNLTKTIVVGIWDALDENLDFTPHNSGDDWLIEFGDNNLSNTDYISVSNTNTRITLLEPGWYRINLNLLLLGIDISNHYYLIWLYVDGAYEFLLDRHQTSTTFVSSLHYIDSSAFIYSNGTNYIELNGYSNNDDFDITGNHYYNQFMIEYITT
ncbi:hypothetical protein LCGC14_1288030 [marine sediment metagenome]|uniref:TNF family profile domain-containing protein n=1 Tax=marine sediment metagenome TaxID=412755 RepID=A0A0F9LE88_9ZZZZ